VINLTPDFKKARSMHHDAPHAPDASNATGSALAGLAGFGLVLGLGVLALAGLHSAPSAANAAPTVAEVQPAEVSDTTERANVPSLYLNAGETGAHAPAPPPADVPVPSGDAIFAAR
jgi:hypothetical protein